MTDNDWEEAAATMADVYDNAFLTIAATASKDSNGGLFSKPDSPFWPTKLASSTLHVVRIRLSVWTEQLGYLQQIFGDWPILDRAWVYQERMLSRRVIHYTDIELVWECCTAFKSERGDFDIDDIERSTVDLTQKHDTREIPFKCPLKDTETTWQRIIQDYSHLKMTFERDRLPAIAAVVQRMMHARLHDEYVAGMWRSSLLQDLLWYVIPGQVLEKSVSTAPIWSWASTRGSVHYDPQFSPTILPKVQLLDLSYTQTGPLHVGSVVNASIRLRAPSRVVSIHWNEKPESSTSNIDQYYATPLEPIPFLRHLEFDPDYDLRSSENPIKQGDKVTLAAIESYVRCSRRIYGYWRFLVLRQKSQGTFEQIGVCGLRTLAFRGDRRDKTLGNSEPWQSCRQFIASMPVKEFVIF